MVADRWPMSLPLPILTDVGGTGRESTQWYLDGVREFFRCFADRGPNAGFLSTRERPLVALPLVGTGDGGMAGQAGEMVDVLFPVLVAEAERHHCDVALVLRSEPAFHAAQSARRHWQPDEIWNACLGAGNVAEAQRLSQLAVDGRLVLFLGAGVSAGAQLPDWNGLLLQLAASLDMPAEEFGTEGLTEVGSLDIARLIQMHLEKRRVAGQTDRSLGEQIAECLRSHTSYSLAHGLIASMPVTEMITTNYDRLMEAAAAGCGRPLTVLPYEPSETSRRWLLKLHGCLEHPQDIVLTRSDYLRYDDRRAALRGIVQAMLMTRHMLFLGFSLTDDNFHRIADDVRKALSDRTRVSENDNSIPQFGTAVTLRTRPWLERLWHGDLCWVRMSEGSPASTAQTTLSQIDETTESNENQTAAAARRVEIFLDLLALQSTDASGHLLDDRFQAVLGTGESQLRSRLLDMMKQIGADERQTSAWKRIERLLESLGSDRSKTVR